MFFMADDNWHHLEGTLQPGGVFRVYFYNDYTRPISAKTFSGQAVVKNADGREVQSLAMKNGRIDNVLEAAIRGRALPLSVSLKVRFKPDDRDRLFDFTFQDYSKEPVVAAEVRPQERTPPRLPEAAPAATVPYSTPQPPAPQVVLPNTVPELLAELTTRNEEVRSLVSQGQLSSVWFPAITAKDVALALSDHERELPDPQRVAAAAATKRLVLAAWQIDAYGDRGDGQNLGAVYKIFAEAVADITSAYAAVR
jgi:hypothetical protein